MEDKLFVNDSFKFETTPSIITFMGKDGKEILRIEPSGDIYYNGRLVENDKQVVDGLREFLGSHGYY